MIRKYASHFKIYKVASSIAELNDKSGIVASAIEEKRGDFVYAWVHAVTANEPNGNHDLFELDELKANYKTFVGRSMFLDHQSQSVANAVGKVVDAKLMYDKKADKFYVGCLIKVSKKTQPEIAANLEDGIIDSVSMGASVSQCYCPICNTIASEPSQFCWHLNNLGKIDPKTGKKCISINRGVNFTELSFVSVPADYRAKIKRVFAKLSGSNSVLASKLLDDTLNNSIDTISEDYKDNELLEQTVDRNLDILNNNKVSDLDKQKAINELKRISSELFRIYKLSKKDIKRGEEEMINRLDNDCLDKKANPASVVAYPLTYNIPLSIVFKDTEVEEKKNFDEKIKSYTLGDTFLTINVGGMDMSFLFNNYSNLDKMYNINLYAYVDPEMDMNELKSTISTKLEQAFLGKF